VSERVSFNEAASQLGLSPKQLEELVASGGIACDKDGDEIVFAQAALDAHRGGEPEIILSDGEIDLLEGDDDIDFGIDLGDTDAESTTPEPVAEPTPVRSGEIELSLDDDLEIDLGGGDDLAPGGEDETVLNLEGVLDDSETTTPLPGGDLLDDTGMGDETLLDTDILDLGDEDSDTFELDTTEDTLLDPAEEGTLLRGGGARVMQMKRKKSHAAWTAVLAVATLLLFLPFAVTLSVIYSNAGGAEGLGERNQWISEWGEPCKGVVDALADLLR